MGISKSELVAMLEVRLVKIVFVMVICLGKFMPIIGVGYSASVMVGLQ
uniref:Uncharacterized protein n=1 Tax=Anguilla anguilla TaxID=7936 RepID=A0A0E9W9C2_ANGAN